MSHLSPPSKTFGLGTCATPFPTSPTIPMKSAHPMIFDLYLKILIFSLRCIRIENALGTKCLTLSCLHGCCKHVPFALDHSARFSPEKMFDFEHCSNYSSDVS